ncbi:hypothetical protein C8F04DRAFT_29930 [Mycena alexandri]|uniref:Postreplication repair E3 ubiquitin-protein ligase RAD18 n=1 Tax=Mycena alexandri TaxID=1745969 RepID=A0AAD6TAV2_9AGAR|nr:hypothetical protein C8F04DRAFT_29930 [Mycena alexandri]
MNSVKLKTLLAQDISDPTDFPKDAPSLQTLDAAVRCGICANYFDGPVSLFCGHCFCSLCIRDVISRQGSKAVCPTCRNNMNESQLRPNPGIEDVVAAWKLARPYVLSLAKPKPKEAEAESAPDTPDQHLTKKRKRSPSCVAGPSRTSSSDAKSDVDIIPSSDAPTGDVPKPDATVECPICAGSMRYKELDRHIENNCAPSPPTAPPKSQKAMWSTIMQPKSKGKEKAPAVDEYLPKVSYDTLKDRQLKDKLAEQGLAVTGDRALWTERLQRWTMLWNANLDKSALHRQSRGELHKELKRWEEERKNRKKKTTVDDDHVKTQNAEFKKLVAAARPQKSKGSGSGVVPSSPPPPSSAVQPSEQDIIVIDDDLEMQDDL